MSEESGNFEVREWPSYKDMEDGGEGKQCHKGTELECQRWITQRWASKGEVFWGVQEVKDD